MRGIGKRYGATTALAGVDFSARAGEIHAILGENGAGKSTLMQILAGLTRPDDGEIRLQGAAVTLASPREARRHGIAMVHQHFTLVPAFTVAENLALDSTPARGHSRARYEPRTAAGPALDQARALGWDLPAASRVSDLPVGTQQRVEIVKALATEAAILIFDEPTAVLTRAEIEELFGVLRRLRDTGKSVILIAHKLAEIMAVADRVTVLRRGAVAASVGVTATDQQQLAAWMIGGMPEASRPAEVTRPEHAAQPPELPVPRTTLDASGASSGLEAKQIQISGERGVIKLNSISFAVGQGEIFGIGGVDGNGQSELAELLTGLRTPLSGSLRWNRRPLVPGRSVRMGSIPQDRRRLGLATSMSVADNLLLEAVQEPAYRRGPFLRARRLRDLAAAMIREFDIRTPGPGVRASALSGGNQQKIVVARALRADPELIIAMNPTRGLDIGATRFVHDALRSARKRGAAVVVISTDLDELTALSDRAAILAAGSMTPVNFHTTDGTQLGLMLGGSPAPSDLAS